MNVRAISGANSRINISSLKKTKQVNGKSEALNRHIQISFAGNPDKVPEQIAAYATESNYLGGIYKAGGLGDVAEALPEALANHAKEVTNGKELDVRTFVPYYSFDNSDGKIYVAPKDTVEKIEKKEPVYYKRDGKQADFKYENVNYKLKQGEKFVLITESKDGSKVDKLFLLDDIEISGKVERAKRTGLDMESIPYRIFKAQTPDRKDQTYVIYTPEMASGKTAYGIYSKYNGGGNGTTAYGSTAYGSTAYGASSSDGGNGIEQAIKDGKFKLAGSTAGDMFFTEQIRAMEEGIEKMAKQKAKKFNPQSILLHDRFAYVYISDAMQKAKDGNRHYQGLRFVPIFHNPGRDKQGVYANPFDYFRVVATKEDAKALKADKHYKEIEDIAQKVIDGKATEEESASVYKFFKGYFPNMIDSEGTFNMTMIPIAATKAQPDNCKPGNVSKFYGRETRELPDIAQGITDKLDEISELTVDVVNGAKPANMATDAQGGFFGYGTLNAIFKDVNDERHYRPFKATDSVETIFEAKQENKKNLINILADATKELENDKDAIAKVFFNDMKMQGIRGQAQDENLPLTLGGFSEFKEGDILMTSWGRPDPQKGLVTTLAAFKETLMDESIPLETRKHLKLIMGAGGGNDAFSGDNSEWVNIQKIMKEISEIEVNGEKGVFKNNALYVNGLFPNRIGNCVDLAVFTSRWEPCGITPFESFATGTPVLSIKTGGAPDFITEGKNGFLTKSAFMVQSDVLGLAEDATYEEIDEARVKHSAKQVSEALRDKYLTPFLGKGSEKVKFNKFAKKQKEYIGNCLEQKIEWHNNSAYNQGRSALDLYAHDKCRTQDNEVEDKPVSSLRGEFDDEAMVGITSDDPFDIEDEEVKAETKAEEKEEKAEEVKPVPVLEIPKTEEVKEEQTIVKPDENKEKKSGVGIGKILAPIIAVVVAGIVFIKSKLGKKKEENKPASSEIKETKQAQPISSKNSTTAVTPTKYAAPKLSKLG
ncbi:glycosyltransferase [bacterium]|nr:glycosyltransferase [bacterium]